MDTIEALLTRRSIYDFADRPVPADAIRRALHAGCHAPNHRLTEPWGFVVVGPETQAALAGVQRRVKLGDATALAVLPPDQREAQVAKAEKAVRKFAAMPACVIVTSRRAPDDAFREREDYAATCCAIQNVQLALWSGGIGCQWSTGPLTRDPETYRLLDIDPARDEIVGLLRIGYPQAIPTVRRMRVEDAVRETR